MTYTNVLIADESRSSSFSYSKKARELRASSNLHRQSLNPQNIAIEQNSNMTDELTSKILRLCISKKQGMHPRKFCRRWFGLEKIKKNGQPRFREEQIIAMESEHGYREKCINLIARLLKIKPNTIHRWGKGVEFDKISPDKLTQYEIYLGYIDTIRVMTSSFAESEPELLLRFARNLSAR